MLGLGPLSGPPEQVGLEQVPVTGEAPFGRAVCPASSRPRPLEAGGRRVRRARGRRDRRVPRPGETAGCRRVWGCCPPPETARNRSIALSSAATASRRGFLIAWVEQAGLDPASGLRPAQDGRLKPQLPLARRVGVFLEEPVEQLDRFRPAPAAHARVVRSTGRPGRASRPSRAPAPRDGRGRSSYSRSGSNSRQMPRQLVVGRRSGAIAPTARRSEPQADDADNEPTCGLK